MLDLLHAVLLVVAALLLVPAGVLLVQVVAAMPPSRHKSAEPASPMRRPRIAVLVPAHNEAAGITPTLQAIAAQLTAADRVLVVADNCVDATVKVAADAGAEVVERMDSERRGKGYALDFGVTHLRAAPPDVVVVVDADCVVHPGSLERIASLCRLAERPVQALYLMHAPEGAGLKTRVAAFAWAVRNHARALGYQRLGLPCQLMGTGMAFPWPVIEAAPLATGHIVEDMCLGLDLASVGRPPLFCADALVTSSFPLDAPGIANQRARWEEGHLSVIARKAPPALWRAIVYRKPALAAMVLDLCVPPLTIFVLLLALQGFTDLAFYAASGRAMPLMLAGVALAMLASSVALAWWRFGRDIVSLGDLLASPLYVLSKFPIYARFFKRGEREWVSARDKQKK